MNSIASALDPKNFEKFEIPTNIKKYSVKVKPEVRKEQKNVWINQQQQRPGQPKAQNIIPNEIGVIGAAAKKANSPQKAWNLFF